MKRIGMLTSGGDCQALNAAMRGVVKSLLNSGEQVEIYGFLDGYRGLIYSNFRMLTWSDFSGILTKGGTILGSSRTPFKTIKDPDENGIDKVDAYMVGLGDRNMSEEEQQNVALLMWKCLPGKAEFAQVLNSFLLEKYEEGGDIKFTLPLYIQDAITHLVP